MHIYIHIYIVYNYIYLFCYIWQPVWKDAARAAPHLPVFYDSIEKWVDLLDPVDVRLHNLHTRHLEKHLFVISPIKKHALVDLHIVVGEIRIQTPLDVEKSQVLSPHTFFGVFQKVWQHQRHTDKRKLFC